MIVSKLISIFSSSNKTSTTIVVSPLLGADNSVTVEVARPSSGTSWTQMMNQVIYRMPNASLSGQKPVRLNDKIPLGIYECPFPYKRLLSDNILNYILTTNRFVFLKDTSCDLDIMERRLSIIGESSFGLYNANVETLAATTVKGAAGFSGVLANVTVKLVRCLMEYPLAESGIGKKAQILTEEFSDFLLGVCYSLSLHPS